jgi:hypothetical protein
MQPPILRGEGGNVDAVDRLSIAFGRGVVSEQR